eukprot:764754-Hanusia_phi.AAC.1
MQVRPLGTTIPPPPSDLSDLDAAVNQSFVEVKNLQQGETSESHGEVNVDSDNTQRRGRSNRAYQRHFPGAEAFCDLVRRPAFPHVQQGVRIGHARRLQDQPTPPQERELPCDHREDPLKQQLQPEAILHPSRITGLPRRKGPLSLLPPPASPLLTLS